jgi:murein DD-endopeptidase MepM/ murein hydrolase activator NlpD
MKKLMIASAFSLVLGACGTQEPVAVNTYGVDKGAGSVGVHTVLEGDTVYEIAQNYHLPVREIITLNNISAPYVLNAGYRMKLPPPNEHRVKEGDTVEIVAKMYEVSPNRLTSLNNLQSPYQLRVGQVLRLPTPTQKAIEDMNVANPVENASVQPVERQVVRTIPREDVEYLGQSDSNIVTPDQKPQVQQASVSARASIPSQTPKMSGNGKLMQPVNGNIVSSFGPKADGLHNDGINISAVKGAPVRAAENGVVVYTGNDLEGYGNLVLIRHDGKLMTAYAHLDKMLVKRGDIISRGASIGTVGTTGQVDRPQLHFEVREGTKALDPARYL